MTKHSSHILSVFIFGVGIIIVWKLSNQLWQIIGGLLLLSGIMFAAFKDIEKDEITESKEENYAEKLIEEIKNE